MSAVVSKYGTACAATLVTLVHDHWESHRWVPRRYARRVEGRRPATAMLETIETDSSNRRTQSTRSTEPPKAAMTTASTPIKCSSSFVTACNVNLVSSCVVMHPYRAYCPYSVLRIAMIMNDTLNTTATGIQRKSMPCKGISNTNRQRCFLGVGESSTICNLSLWYLYRWIGCRRDNK